MRTVRAGGSGEVLFEAPDDFEIRVEPTRTAPVGARRWTRDAAGSGPDETLGAALKDAGLTIAADARIDPAGGPARRADADVVRIVVDVRENESAVVLLESRDGVYAWLPPDGQAGGRELRAGAPAGLTFTVGDPATGGRHTRSLTGWIAEGLTRPVRTLVLKFLVGLTIDAVTARIEGESKIGLVRILSPDPQTWHPGRGTLPEAPDGRPMRVLIMVHGTFSNTAGSFGAMNAHPAGRFFLESALDHYDAVLGYDHKTLAHSVETNAELIADALSELPDDAEVDAIAYSRGGLVLRTLFDDQNQSGRPRCRLRRAIFVGCTNAGTSLAQPANWETMVDLYTNIVMAGGRAVTLLAAAPLDPVVRLALRTLGEFVRLLPQVAIRDRRLPGLASMQPGSDVVMRLAESTAAMPASEYHVVTSNFAPRFEADLGMTRELAQLLIDRVSNRLWLNEKNDLVVDTRSMASFGKRAAWLTPERTYDFGDVETIYHTVYFTAPETAERLIAWLGLPSLPQQLMPTRRTREVSTRIDVSSTSTSRSTRGSKPPDRVDLSPAPATSSSRKPVSIDLGRLKELQAWPNPDGAPVDDPNALPCHVAASMPETSELGRNPMLEVLISLEETTGQEGVIRSDAVLEISPDRELKVQVSGRSNCAIIGDDCLTTRPPRPREPIALGFEVQGYDSGPAEIWVDVYQRSRRLARMVLQPQFVASRTVAATALLTPREIDPPLVDLRILEEGDDGRWRLRFLVSAPELGIEDEHTSEWQTINKIDYIASIYRRMEDSWADTRGEFDSLTELVRADGADLFRGLFPSALQKRIWDERQRIGSLQVFAQEPSIPWEVAFVTDPDRKALSREGCFLAEFGLTRWITNVGVAPAALRLRRGKALYCIPEYLDRNLRLPSQAAEAAMLRQKFDAIAMDPHIQPVLSHLRREAGADFDLLHFACHGSADARRIWESGLLLEGFERDGRIAREELSVSAVRNNAELAHDGVKPIVFLNACQTAVGGHALSGAGGLAQAFVRGGAGLFVGTLWSVGDGAALTFSSTFYEALVEGRTVVQATRAAREAAKAEREVTWLSYSVYGHPYARAAG